MSERECDYCGGQGWYGEPEHGPGCTSDKCEQRWMLPVAEFTRRKPFSVPKGEHT